MRARMSIEGTGRLIWEAMLEAMRLQLRGTIVRLNGALAWCGVFFVFTCVPSLPNIFLISSDIYIGPAFLVLSGTKNAVP
jgi:hypothetical protein